MGHCIRNNSTLTLFAHLVRIRHIRFRSRLPRSHVKPSAVICASPKIQVSHALNTWGYCRSSTRTMRAEIRGRSGAHIMVTWRVVSPLSPSPTFSYALAKPQCLCGDAARYNAPTSNARRHLFTSVFESWWKSDAGEDSANNAIPMFRKKDCVAFIGDMRRTACWKWNFVETRLSILVYEYISCDILSILCTWRKDLKN